MAKDYLAIPGSSTASERVFSAEGRIVTDYRNRLTPKMIERLLILRGSYSAGDLEATMFDF